MMDASVQSQGKAIVKTKVPFDEDYVKLLGTAVYLFSYYEWIIIYMIERLEPVEPGFVVEYSREKTMTSGGVRKRFKKALEKDAGGHDVDRSALRSCSDVFAELVPRRNALIHAHPITDTDGAQIFNYQGNPSKPISDMKWKKVDIKKFTEEVDAAVCRANELLHQFKP